MCTRICPTPNAMMVSVAIVVSAITSAITSQNGMAVRTTERANPIR
jgi:hypothetical protein